MDKDLDAVGIVPALESSRVEGRPKQCLPCGIKTDRDAKEEQSLFEIPARCIPYIGLFNEFDPEGSNATEKDDDQLRE